MKNLRILLVLCICCTVSQKILAQHLNWPNLKKEGRHILMFNTGIEYGLIFGAGYSYQLKTSLPALLHIEYSVPSGENLLDDFKTRIGGQVSFYHTKSFYFSASLYGIYRRNQNAFVRLQNFGAEVSGTIGYYKPKWYTALELGFDKAVITHFKHTAQYKENFPDVQDGWYEPATGGNFNAGLLVGYSFKKFDIFFRGGKLASQNFSTPLLPFYVQLGCNIKFKGQAKGNTKRAHG